MRIAFICTEKLPVPPISGGAIQIYIDGIMPILLKYHELTVFSIQSNMLPNIEVSEGVRYIRVPGRTTNEYLNNIKKEIKDEYDLVYVFNRPLWVLPLTEAVPNSAFSLSLHNEMFIPEKISPELAKRCIEKVSFITTVSNFIAEGVKKLYPVAESKLNVVYSGVDINKYKPLWSEDAAEDRKVMRRQYGIDNRKVVIFVGRLSSKKGAHILIKAMGLVMTSYPDTALVFVGSKWYGKNETDEYIRQLQKMTVDLKGPVIFTGFLPPSEIPKYYNIGDIFVCSSQWREPLARVHYEAMAAGLPIITTKRGGNAEVVEEEVNGLIVEDYNSPESMAKKITYLLENPEAAQEMGKAGRALSEEKYNWNRVAKQLLELFDTV